MFKIQIPQRSFLLRIALAILLALLGHVMLWLSSVGPMKPWGSKLPLLFFFGPGIVTLSLLLANLAALVIGVGYIFRWERRAAAIPYLLFVMLSIVARPLGWLGEPYASRFAEVERLSIRAAPLINAIKRYEKELGAPPDSLQQLTPKYLTEIPPTGFGAFPEYEYQKCIPQAFDCYENSWLLRIETPMGITRRDSVFYLPNGRYPPETAYGGEVENIADWAYVVDRD